MAISDIVIIALIVLSALSGLFSGFVKKTSGLVCVCGTALITFYLGGTIANLLSTKVTPIVEWLAENEWGSFLVLVLSYVGTVIVSFILLRIIMKILESIVNALGIVGSAINKILGLAAGICVGFVLADVYVWGLYGLSLVSPDIATWVIEDAKLALDGVNSFTQAIMNFNLGTINATFPL